MATLIIGAMVIMAWEPLLEIFLSTCRDTFLGNSMVECRTVNAVVSGSNPLRGAKQFPTAYCIMIWTTDSDLEGTEKSSVLLNPR